MKKNFFVALVVLLVFATAYSVYTSEQEVKMPELALDNIEALAFCEITKGNKARLRCDGEGTCSKSYLGYTLTCDGTEVK